MPAVFHLNELGDDFIEVESGGAIFKLSPLTIGGRSRIQATVRKVADDPMDLANIASRGQAPAVVAEIFKVAIRQRAYFPPAIDSEDGVALILRSIDLQVAVVAEMLRKFQPDTTTAQAAAIVDVMDPLRFADLATYAWTGKRPGDPNPTPADQATRSIGTN